MRRTTCEKKRQAVKPDHAPLADAPTNALAVCVPSPDFDEWTEDAKILFGDPKQQQGLSGPDQRSVQIQSQAKSKSWPTKVPVGAKNIKVWLKWVESQRFGLKLGPNEF